MKRTYVLATCGATALASFQSCLAWDFQTRVVERIGNMDFPLGDEVAFLPGSTHRLRLQFGVFDDAGGPAPQGGVNGWSLGTVDVIGGGTWTRTPGRLSPFSAFGRPQDNGLPQDDPFTMLTGIDASIVEQGYGWLCDASGMPLPMPPPVIRGRNTFISLYEVTVAIPGDQSSHISLEFGGQLTAAQRWAFQGTPIPPDCDTGEPGQVVYFAVLEGHRPLFTRDLMIVPAPWSAGVIALGVFTLRLRRRRP